MIGNVRRGAGGLLLQKLGTIYVHWPFCSRICTYCNFNKYVRDEVDHAAMRNALIREIKSLLTMSSVDHVTSIYFGGGTPSLAEPATVAAVIDTVANHATLDPNAEINLEANPTSAEMKKLSAFKAAGVNRLSLGIQSLDDADLLVLNRDHTAEQATRVLKAARSIYCENVNVDLMFGRPGQTLESWTSELSVITDICSRHLSLYQLTVEPGTALSKSVKNGEVVLPDSDMMADMYETAVDTLKTTNLHRYEISNFSRRGYESRHNLAYWRGTDYLGVGPGAHSRFKSPDGDGYVSAINVLEPNAWIEKVQSGHHGLRVAKKISDVERLEEVVATSLRTFEGLTNEIWKRFSSRSLQEVFLSSNAMSRYYENGFLTLGDSGLRATNKGLQVLDSILPDCCAVLQAQDPPQVV